MPRVQSPPHSCRARRPGLHHLTALAAALVAAVTVAPACVRSPSAEPSAARRTVSPGSSPTSSAVPSASEASRPSAGSTSTAIPTASVPSPPPPPDPDHVQSQADCPQGMVFIPAGRFAYEGPAFDPPLPERHVKKVYDIAAFCIDLREVSVIQVAAWSACHVPFYTRYCTREGVIQTCFTQAEAQTCCDASLPGVSRRLPRPEEWLYAALGTDGRRFPWGNTWYPWGDDRHQGRPDSKITGKHFCDFSHEWGQLTRESKLVFDRNDCSPYAPSLDVGPFGVENMGSNVLEWTGPSCTVMGINHIVYPPPPDDPEEATLVYKHPISCDPSKHPANGSSDVIGFRCVTTKKAEVTAPRKAP